MRHNDMLRQFEERRQAICQVVTELRHQRDDFQKEHSRLSEAFETNSSLLEDAMARLKNLNTRLAVTERKVKVTRAETSLLRRKHSDISQDAVSLQMEAASLDAEFQELGQKKDRLHEEIASTEAARGGLLSTIDAVVLKKQRLLSQVEAYELKREDLSRQIARKLSATASDKQYTDADLNDVTAGLMEAIAARDFVRNLLSDSASAMAALRENVSSLERRRRALEEARDIDRTRKALSSAVSKFGQELESIELKIEEQQKSSDSRQNELNDLLTSNVERKKSIADLESKVGPYDDLISKIRLGESRLADLSDLNDRGISEIEDMFIDAIRLESKLGLLESKLKIIRHLTASLIVDRQT